MTDFQKVAAGDPILDAMTAAWYNHTIEGPSQYGIYGRGRPETHFPEPSVVEVLNNSQRDLDQFSILGLDDPLFNPQSRERQFRNLILFGGSSPVQGKHDAKWVVTLGGKKSTYKSPISCVAYGVVQCRLHLMDRCHDMATLVDDVTTHVQSSEKGRARILWLEKPNTLGIQWAIIGLSNLAQDEYCESDSSFSSSDSSVSTSDSEPPSGSPPPPPGGCDFTISESRCVQYADCITHYQRTVTINTQTCERTEGAWIACGHSQVCESSYSSVDDCNNDQFITTLTNVFNQDLNDKYICITEQYRINFKSEQYPGKTLPTKIELYESKAGGPFSLKATYNDLAGITQRYVGIQALPPVEERCYYWKAYYCDEEEVIQGEEVCVTIRDCGSSDSSSSGSDPSGSFGGSCNQYSSILGEANTNTSLTDTDNFQADWDEIEFYTDDSVTLNFDTGTDDEIVTFTIKFRCEEDGWWCYVYCDTGTTLVHSEGPELDVLNFDFIVPEASIEGCFTNPDAATPMTIKVTGVIE